MPILLHSATNRYIMPNSATNRFFTGKEGSTVGVICDSVLQMVLGMRLWTVSDSQIENIQKLIDTLPPVEENHVSELGLIIACDWGYGKHYL
jgi:hypothetical protein